MARMVLILISSEVYGINVRGLSAAVRAHGHEPFIYFVTQRVDGPLAAQVAAETSRLHPDVVGLSVMTDVSADAARLSAALRQHTRAPILWGGVHTSVAPDKSLDSADYIFLGEAEETLCGFLDEFVNGKSFERDGVYSRWDALERARVFAAPVADLNALPTPCLEWDAHFIFSGGAVVSGREAQERLLGWTYHTMMSRGCPFNCSYCYNNYLHSAVKGRGHYFRNRSVPRILGELSAAAGAFSVLKRVFFWDDNFLARGDGEIEQFAADYKREIGLPFGMLGNPANSSLHKLRALKDAGLDYFQMGLQSGSESVNRNIYGRPTDMNKFLDTARGVAAMGIREVRYDLIFNNPYETVDQIRESIGALLEIPRPYIFNGFNLVFFPGTRLYERALADGLIEPGVDASGGSLFDLKNSPIHFPLSHRMPDLLYSVKYAEGGKRYYNLLIYLIVCTKMPRGLIRLLASYENVLTRPLPALLVRLVLAARGVKSFFRLRPKVNPKNAA